MEPRAYLCRHTCIVYLLQRTFPSRSQAQSGPNSCGWMHRERVAVITSGLAFVEHCVEDPCLVPGLRSSRSSVRSEVRLALQAVLNTSSQHQIPDLSSLSLVMNLLAFLSAHSELVILSSNCFSVFFS